MADGKQEFVSVPVPVEHVTKVYELIARLDGGGGPNAPSDEPSGNGGGSRGPLTRALVERMFRESESGGTQRGLMEYLADRPGEWVGTLEVAEALGLANGRHSLAGSLGAFGRRADHRYGGLKPWESQWSDDEGESKHRMSLEVAAWIKDTAP